MRNPQLGGARVAVNDRPVESSAQPAGDLLEDTSLEVTGKDAQQLLAVGGRVRAGTQVNVTALGAESLEIRLQAVRAIRHSQLVPTVHMAARRVKSSGMLVESLSAMRSEYATEQLFVVGGDPSVPEGPFPDALSLIREPLLHEFGVRSISIAGYPEGHPQITGPELWKSLETKAHELNAARVAGDIVTQFGFDVDPVMVWIEEVRQRGITMPIRVGVPGPAGIRRLMKYAGRFGVTTSAGIARKYGFSITNLLGTAGPDRFIDELLSRYDPGRHGVVKLHMYTFGGLAATTDWLAQYGQGVVR